MTTDKNSIEAQLAAVRQTFINQLPQRMEAIFEAHRAWLNKLCGGPELDEFHRLVHSLTGSGATFGMPKLSADSRILEQYLKALKEKTSHDATDQAEVERLLQIIVDAIDQPIIEAATTTTTVPPSAPQTPSGKLVHIFDSTPVHGHDLVEQLKHLGYQVCLYTSADEFSSAVAKQRPSIMLIEDEGNGLTTITKIQAKLPSNIPVIFITNHTDFQTRLNAIRAGSAAFFTRPVAVESLIDAIETILDKTPAEPPRVLVVDDVQEQADLNAMVLRQAGMTVQVETDAMKVYQALDTFQPELILMDMHMPKCSGTELASIIRQRPDYVGIPITFLSSETDRKLQLNAMRHGGDEFLNKPLAPRELAEAVRIRVERYRTLRTYMTRDGLTGLLNHSSVLEKLEVEIARNHRYGDKLCFAMIDIDHFKQVNDRYGHGAGDSVLKNLARLLQQRLRKTDIIGRYGGEEFVIIMPQTTPNEAFKVIDEIREHFALFNHPSGTQQFQVTFSGGISSCPPLCDIIPLLEAADQVLYRAKENGRNQIILHD